MTIQQLQYIVALDTHRHYVQAAEACHVSQPNLTMQVKKLEESMGLQIFDRETKPLSPTPMGVQVILKARQILREVAEMKALVNNEMEGIEGSFHCAIIPTLAPYLLPRFLPEFIHEYPNTKLNIREMQSLNIIQALQEGSIDFAFIVTPLEEQGLREIPLFYEPFMLYAHPDHSVHQQQKIRSENLSPEDLLLLSEGHCFREQSLNLCQKPGSTEHKGFRYQSGSIEGLKGLVRKNFGFTLVPELSVEHQIDAPYLKKFHDSAPVREVSLVCHQSFTKERLLEVLALFVKNRLPDHFQTTQTGMRVKWR